MNFKLGTWMMYDDPHHLMHGDLTGQRLRSPGHITPWPK